MRFRRPAPLDVVHEPEPVDIWEGVDAALTDTDAEPTERGEGLVDRSARVRDVEQVDGFGDAIELGGAIFRGGGAKQVERLPGGTFDRVGDELAGGKDGELAGRSGSQLGDGTEGDTAASWEGLKAHFDHDGGS